MIIDIRGTHGSGKSTIAIRLIQKYKAQAILADNHLHHKPARPPRGGVQLGQQFLMKDRIVTILGKYDSQCGGCDGIPTQDEIVARMKMFAAVGDVILEGALVSHTFERWDQQARLVTTPWHFLFLDTPLDVCIARVEARRKAKGNDKPLDPKNIIKDWNRARQLHVKFKEAGHSVNWLPHEDPVPAVERLLRKGKF